MVHSMRPSDHLNQNHEKTQYMLGAYVYDADGSIIHSEGTEESPHGTTLRFGALRSAPDASPLIACLSKPCTSSGYGFGLDHLWWPYQDVLDQGLGHYQFMQQSVFQSHTDVQIQVAGMPHAYVPINIFTIPGPAAGLVHQQATKLHPSVRNVQDVLTMG